MNKCKCTKPVTEITSSSGLEGKKVADILPGLSAEQVSAAQALKAFLFYLHRVKIPSFQITQENCTSCVLLHSRLIV